MSVAHPTEGCVISHYGSGPPREIATGWYAARCARNVFWLFFFFFFQCVVCALRCRYLQQTAGRSPRHAYPVLPSELHIGGMVHSLTLNSPSGAKGSSHCFWCWCRKTLQKTRVITSVMKIILTMSTLMMNMLKIIGLLTEIEQNSSSSFGPHQKILVCVLK